MALDLPAGEWGFTAYYDKNADGKLNTKIFGIPKEPNGLSLDPKPRMGAPKWNQSVIVVGAEAVEISFKIREM